MKTNTLRNKKLYLSSASALFLLCSCVNGEKSSSPGAQDSLSYLYQDVPPETYGGPWKRVWNVVGPYAADAAVDEMLDRNTGNWSEIARTTREGIFVQKDTTREVRYRFDGILESDWMPILADTVVTQLKAENHFSGRRCVVPADTTLVISNQRLVFKCDETIIEGKIIAYPGNTYHGRGAGSVNISSNTIAISGSIHLAGEQGNGGSNGRDGQDRGRHNDTGGRSCGNGGNGGPGGNGGVIQIFARKELKLSSEKEQLKVTGGSGGWGGRRGMGPGNCRDGYAGAPGTEGTIQVISPERPLQ